jgi:hypothetical protein
MSFPRGAGKRKIENKSVAEQNDESPSLSPEWTIHDDEPLIPSRLKSGLF